MPKRKVDWHGGDSRMVHKFEIEIEYVHNLKELYKRLHFYLEDQGWKDLWGRGEYEVRYWQRDLPGGDMHEHHIWWRAYKHPESTNYDNKFFKYFLKIDYQTIAASRQQVMHKGKKWKLDKSNTILRVQSHLILDWGEGWEAGLLKGLQKNFRQWIYKDKIADQEDALFGITADFQNEIKRFLEVSGREDQEPNIYPPNMLP